MKFKCYYRKNLKMTPEKLSAQIAHVVKGLNRFRENENYSEDIVIVLGVSDKKFNEQLDYHKSICSDIFIQVDKGYTEVPSGTTTAFGYVDYVRSC